MSDDRPKPSEMNWLRLLEGPHNGTVLDIAPTMERLACKGERYNRMPRGWGTEPGGEGRTEYGGIYLWAGWTPADGVSPR